MQLQLYTSQITFKKIAVPTANIIAVAVAAASSTAVAVTAHGHQSSSFIVKCNGYKFMRGTSYNAEAGLDSCK